MCIFGFWIIWIKKINKPNLIILGNSLVRWRGNCNFRLSKTRKGKLMKSLMKSLVVLISIVLVPAFCFSEDLSYQEKRKLREAGYSYSQIRKIERQMDRNQFQRMEPEYKYKGSMGNRYKYDLSQPGDQLKYELDVGAQLKDSIKIPIRPSVDLERSLGQYGGGID